MSAVLVDTTNANNALNGTGRHLATTSNGVLWSILWSNADGRFELWYSTDAGATWTEDTGSRITANSTYASIFVDQDDYLHIVYTHSSGSTNYLYYRRGTPNAGKTAWTLSSASQIVADTTYRFYCDIVAHRQGTGWKAHIVYSEQLTGNPNSTKVQYQRFNIASGGTITSDAAPATIQSGSTNAIAPRVSIDFRHTGDGKTVDTSHDVWVAFCQDETPYVAKLTYASTPSWTAGTPRSVGTGECDNEVSCRYDGNGLVYIAYIKNISGAVGVKTRDASDTTTTNVSPGSNPTANALRYCSLSQRTGEIGLMVAQLGSDDAIYFAAYDTAAGTWSSWETIYTSASGRQINVASMHRSTRQIFFDESNDGGGGTTDVYFTGDAGAQTGAVVFQGVGTLDATGSLGFSGAVTFQGVGSLTIDGALSAIGAATFQGVGRMTAAAAGIPALDFTVYDLYVDDGTNVTGYLLYEDSNTRSSTAANPVRAQKQDVAQSPLEMRSEFGDPFAQGDFSDGAGQRYYHHVGRDEKKFLASEGFDISEPGVLTHLHTIASAISSATIGAMTMAGDVVLVADGTAVKVGNGAFPGSWTSEDPSGAEAAATVNDLTSRGDEVFAALGADGVHVRSSGGTWTHYQADGTTDLDVGTATRVAYLKDRLFAVGQAGRDIYEVVADSTPASMKTLPVGWTYEQIFEAGAYVYATAVNTGARMSRVHIFGLNSAGDAMEDKGSVPIPRGELVYAGIGTLGQVFLGGGRANDSGGYDPVFYQAVQREEDGFLQLLKLEQGEDCGANDCSVKAFEDLGDSIAFSWSLGSAALTGARAGIAMYHLGRQAFSHHLKKTGASSSQVLDVLYVDGRLLLSISGDGLYYEDLSTYVSQAYLISSIGDWSTAGLKVWDLLEIAYKALPSGASVRVDYSTALPEENDWSEAVVDSTAASVGTSNRLSNLKSRFFTIKLISNALADGSSAPEITSFSVRSNPTRPQPEFVLSRFLRLIAKDRKDPKAPEVFRDPVVDRIALQQLLDSWVTVYEPGVTWTAFVQNVSDATPAEPFISATNGEALKEAFLVRLDAVATGEAA